MQFVSQCFHLTVMFLIRGFFFFGEWASEPWQGLNGNARKKNPTFLLGLFINNSITLTSCTRVRQTGHDLVEQEIRDNSSLSAANYI